MASATAATLLQETLTAFDTHWWPRCENARLCPHWLQESSAGTELEPWGNAELSTIDTALHVCGARICDACLAMVPAADAAAA
jgi:hypothetical protein